MKIFNIIISFFLMFGIPVYVNAASKCTLTADIELHDRLLRDAGNNGLALDVGRKRASIKLEKSVNFDNWTKSSENEWINFGAVTGWRFYKWTISQTGEKSMVDLLCSALVKANRQASLFMLQKKNTIKVISFSSENSYSFTSNFHEGSIEFANHDFFANDNNELAEIGKIYTISFSAEVVCE